MTEEEKLAEELLDEEWAKRNELKEERQAEEESGGCNEDYHAPPRE